MSELRHDFETARAALRRARPRLMNIPGVQAVAVGFKEVAGQRTDIPAIVVFVRHKRPVGPGMMVPARLHGVATDVVNRRFSARAAAVDPSDLQNPMIAGAAIASAAAPAGFGSVGCYIVTTGRQVPYIPAGLYMATAQHVLRAASATAPDVLQPNWTQPGAPPADYTCGVWVAGFNDPATDCAVVDITTRETINSIPDANGDLVQIRGIATAEVGQAVFKYGAATSWTSGTIRYVDLTTSDANIVEAVYVEAVAGQVWADAGDSGAVAVTEDDLLIVAMLAAVDDQTPAATGYGAGYLFPIQRQLAVLCDAGGVVTLA